MGLKTDILKCFGKMYFHFGFSKKNLSIERTLVPNFTIFLFEYRFFKKLQRLFYDFKIIGDTPRAPPIDFGFQIDMITTKLWRVLCF